MFYVIDDHGNKVEAFDKEEVLSVLQQAIANQSLANIMSDSAFVTKLKCCVGAQTHHIAFVTQAKYNELVANEQLLNDAYYFITDDTTLNSINTQLTSINSTLQLIDQNIDLVVARVSALEGNEGNYSVKAEAKQNIAPTTFTTTSLIYEDGATTHPMVDLSSLMLEGKGAGDTIGISGGLLLSFSSGGTPTIPTKFTGLWNECHGNNVFYPMQDAIYRNASEILTYVGYNNTKYMFVCHIGITDDKKLSANVEDCINLTTGERTNVYKVAIQYLSIFYK